MTVENISRIYPHVLFDQPRSLIDFTAVKISLVEKGKLHYKFLQLIGEGSSGKVYRAKNLQTEKIYAIKVFHDKEVERGREEKKHSPTENFVPASVQKEISILNHLKPCLRIIQLEEVFYYENTVHMVFEYVETVFSNGLIKRLSPSNAATYLYQLLKALDYCHSRGIIHCDVKPTNIVLDYKNNLLKLIDFGHAQFYWPDHEYPFCLGTINYKAPEMLFKCEKIHYAVDVWAIGCIFLQMLFPAQAHLFFGSSRDEQIQKLNEKFGTKATHSFCEKYGLYCFKLPFHGGKTWVEFLFPSGTYGISKSSLVSPLALDLLNRLLDLDPINRITCKDALAHKYFSEF